MNEFLLNFYVKNTLSYFKRDVRKHKMLWYGGKSWANWSIVAFKVSNKHFYIYFKIKIDPFLRSFELSIIDEVFYSLLKYCSSQFSSLQKCWIWEKWKKVELIKNNINNKPVKHHFHPAFPGGKLLLPSKSCVKPITKWNRMSILYLWCS